MGHQCCSKQKVKRGLWSPEEDDKLVKYITTHGHGCWSSVPRQAGLQRCGKSCRLRWINYLRPDLKRGCFTENEERIILDVHRILGNRWAQIAKHLPGRTDNEVKNFWNSCIKKKLISQGLDPTTHNLIPNTRRPPSAAAISSNLYRFVPHNTASRPPFTISSAAVIPNDSMNIAAAAYAGAADVPALQYPERDVMMTFEEPFDLRTDFDDDQCCMWEPLVGDSERVGIDHEGRQLSQVMGGAGVERGVDFDLESSFVNARFDLGIMESDEVMMPCTESMFCGGTSIEQLQWEC